MLASVPGPQGLVRIEAEHLFRQPLRGRKITLPHDGFRGRYKRRRHAPLVYAQAYQDRDGLGVAAQLAADVRPAHSAYSVVAVNSAAGRACRPVGLTMVNCRFMDAYRFSEAAMRCQVWRRPRRASDQA